jgi:hypothetical protein
MSGGIERAASRNAAGSVAPRLSESGAANHASRTMDIIGPAAQTLTQARAGQRGFSPSPVSLHPLHAALSATDAARDAQAAPAANADAPVQPRTSTSARKTEMTRRAMRIYGD